MLISVYSQNYATNGSSSGATTPRASGYVTPGGSDGGSTSPFAAQLDTATEKVARRQSFHRATIAPLPSIRASSTGISKEHSEQGRVKKKVYLQYLHAASKSGFVCLILAVIMQQAMSVLSTYMLRLWGEHNRELGRNLGLRDVYLLGYGLCSLASIGLAAGAALILWVFCTLRSAKYLHDTVRCSWSSALPSS